MRKITIPRPFPSHAERRGRQNRNSLLGDAARGEEHGEHDVCGRASMESEKGGYRRQPERERLLEETARTSRPREATRIPESRDDVRSAPLRDKCDPKVDGALGLEKIS